MQQSALQVDVFRGKNLESAHEVSALVLNSAGHTLLSWGDTSRRIYPRSAIKSLQAIAVILSGAAEKFSITPTELALASASHSGEALHLTGVKNWLARMGLSESDLECGAQKQQDSFSALANNCSGKHSGMLASALALGEDTRGYIESGHPVQVLVRRVLEDLCSEKITDGLSAVDGCSIPTYFLPMHSLALAMARFADPSTLSGEYSHACRQIFQAVTDFPYYVAGKDRYCTTMMLELKKRGLIKTGAEGVMMASLPELKIGVVVKVHDGAVRAAEVTMSWLLGQLGVLTADRLATYVPLGIKNWNGIQTGRISVSAPN